MFENVSYKTYSTYSSYPDSYYDNYYAKSNTGFLGMLLGLGLFTWLIIIAVTVLTVIGMWKAFVKSGHDGWEALIAGHNTFVLFQDSGIKSYWIFLLFVPIANLVIPFWLNIEYAKSFGKSVGFGVGLTLLPFVFFPILGMGDAKYMGPAYTENANVNQNNNSNVQNVNTVNNSNTTSTEDSNKNDDNNNL